MSGIVHVIRNGLQWKDAPAATARTRRSKTASSARAGRVVFDRIFAGLAGEGAKPERIMIDATHLSPEVEVRVSRTFGGYLQAEFPFQFPVRTVRLYGSHCPSTVPLGDGEVTGVPRRGASS